MENENKGFRYWFINIFWYHYGKLALVLLAALIVITIFAVDSIRNKVEYDFNMAICVEGAISYNETFELQNIVSKAVGDLNGDGKSQINLQIIDLADPINAEANGYRLQLLMSQPENTLFIFDERYSTTFCSKEDYFDDLSEYGLPYDERLNNRVNITNTGAVRSIGSDIEFYACLCDWTKVGKGKAELTDAAVRAISAILDS